MALRRTLLQLRTNVRSYVDEGSANFWTNAMLNQYVNEAKDRVQTEVRKLDEDYWDVIRTSLDGSVTLKTGETYNCSGFRLVASTISYTGPNDILELRSVRVVTSGSEWIPCEHLDQANTLFRSLRALPDNLSPGRFYWDQIAESGLLVVPRTDTTLDLELTYVPVIPDMAVDADTLEMPQPLYVAVQEYAAATALMQDGSVNAAAWEAKGNASIARFMGAGQRQSQDIEVAQGYMEGG